MTANTPGRGCGYDPNCLIDYPHQHATSGTAGAAMTNTPENCGCVQVCAVCKRQDCLLSNHGTEEDIDRSACTHVQQKAEIERLEAVNKSGADWAFNEMDLLKAENAKLAAEVAEITELSERLKQEAQTQAQEARTANATIAEIYQVCTAGTGEPGNWNGAEPVRLTIERLRAGVAELSLAISAENDATMEAQMEAADITRQLQEAREEVARLKETDWQIAYLAARQQNAALVKALENISETANKEFTMEPAETLQVRMYRVARIAALARKGEQ